MPPTPDRNSPLFRDAELQRLSRVKQSVPKEIPLLGPEMIEFFKCSVEKRQTKFGKIGEAWSRLVPATIDAHCALESYNRGTLVVLVDSASHLYELKQLLLAGLQQQLLITCKSAGLRKISLKPGRWYEGAGEGERKVRFS